MEQLLRTKLCFPKTSNDAKDWPGLAEDLDPHSEISMEGTSEKRPVKLTRWKGWNIFKKSFFSDMNDEVMMREIHRNVGNPGFAKKGVVLSRIYAIFVA